MTHDPKKSMKGRRNEANLNNILFAQIKQKTYRAPATNKLKGTALTSEQIKSNTFFPIRNLGTKLQKTNN